jgi:Spy/CpxP family protein refolding chaperone
MKMRNRLIAGAGLLALLFGTFPVMAQMPEIPPGKWWKRPKVVEQLKLQPEQQDRLDEIFAKNRRSFIDLRAEVERRQVDLEELLVKKDADPKKVASASEALEQAKARLGKARTMLVLEMRGVLTQEQWQRILDGRDRWRAERQEDFRDRRRNPKRPPQGEAEQP